MRLFTRLFVTASLACLAIALAKADHSSAQVVTFLNSSNVPTPVKTTTSPLPVTGSISATVAATATAAPPTYIEGSSDPFSMNLSGYLRTLARQDSTWTVQPGNTANTTAWLVTGTGGTFPVTGTVTANAGTNLNTSALALDATLVAQSAKLPASLGAKTGALSFSVVPNTDTAFPITDNAGSLTVDGATTAADAATLTLNLKTFSTNGFYNGTTVDLGRTITNLATSGIGVQAVGPVGQFNTTPSTLTNGQYGGFQLDSRNNLRVALYSPGSTTTSFIYNNGADNNSNAGLSGLGTYGFNLTYDGTDWDRIRSVIDSTNSVGTGITAAANVAQCDAVSQTALTENNFGNAREDCNNHGLIVKIGEESANTWGASGEADLSAGVTAKAACGAGLRNYITGVQVFNLAATQHRILIKDGAGGGNLYNTRLQAALSAQSIVDFTVPLKGSANTLVQIIADTADVTAYNLQGYCAP